jgi:hypothetical protein
MKRNRWTDEQDAILRAMVADNKCLDTIGAAIGVSKNSAAGRMRRLGLAFEPAEIERRYREALANRDTSNWGRAGFIPSAETRSKRSITIKAKYADPVYKAAQIERMKASFAGLDRAANGRKGSATKMAWCPEYLRADARLMITKAFRTGPTREYILGVFLRDLRRALAAIAAIAATESAAKRAYDRSFEAQLERVRNGAEISERVALASPDYHLSLYGSQLA